jgi:hypothetical protein
MEAESLLGRNFFLLHYLLKNISYLRTVCYCPSVSSEGSTQFLLACRFSSLGHEAGHSPPSSAEVKKVWSYTSTSPYVFMA